MRLTAHEWQTARATCTDRQLEALDLWRRGWGYRSIATTLDIHPTTARGHVEAALHKLGLTLREFAA